MLLKAGIAMILSALALTAVTVTVVALRADSPAEPAFSAEPRAAETKTETKKAEEQKFDPGEKLEIDREEPDGDLRPEPQSRESEPSPEEPSPEEPSSEEPPVDEAQPDAPSAEPPPAESRTERAAGEAEAGESVSVPEVPEWPQPTSNEVAAAEGPRYYEPTPDTSMSLTIEALGLHDVPVVSSYGYETLDRGLMHEPDTSLPWDGGAQRNVFIAGHYLGWPGTASHLVFYNLDKLQSGDEILLEDSAGNAYGYRVSESFMATPDESWVMGQVRGRDMLTLQTCIPPTFADRLVVRADRA